MQYVVRFYSLGAGEFHTVHTQKYESLAKAKQDAINHAEAHNYKNVKFVDDDDYCIRVTATTPNGRAGRNVASIEPDADFS